MWMHSGSELWGFPFVLVLKLLFILQRNFLYCCEIIESFWEYFAPLINLVLCYCFSLLIEVRQLILILQWLMKFLYSYHSKCRSWGCMWASNCRWSLLWHPFRFICNSRGECCFDWRAGMISCLLHLTYVVIYVNQPVVSSQVFPSGWLGLGEGGTSPTYDSSFSSRD